MKHILTVADEAVMRAILRRVLEREGYKVSEANSVEDVFDKTDLKKIDLIISELDLKGAAGTSLIKSAGRTPIIIIADQANLRSAVDTIRAGAADYIAKPFEQEEVLRSVAKLIGEQTRPDTAPGKPDDSTGKISGMLGNCPEIKQLSGYIHKVAPTNSTVLIRGETGTGKELVARAIHRQSHRSAQQLICVNCAAIPETLIESELFGYEKGAFTGANTSRMGLIEAADFGTLFLDEIGELPVEAQARLLRFIQEGEIRRIGSVQSRQVDVRLITATHRDLKTLSAQGLFRQDLYYRINVMKLHLPPLRERGNDIIEIANAFLRRFCLAMDKTQKTFSAAAVSAINSYSWPGNVRELENILERAVLLCDDDVINEQLLDIEEDYNFSINASQPSRPPEIRNQENLNDNSAMDSEEDDNEEGLSLEDYFQRFVLEHQDTMNETELAQKLGVSRKCLWERRQRLGIPRKKQSKQAAASGSSSNSTL